MTDPSHPEQGAADASGCTWYDDLQAVADAIQSMANLMKEEEETCAACGRRHAELIFDRINLILNSALEQARTT